MRGQQAHWLARPRTRSREKAGKKMICTQCGKENPEDARFCAYCGGIPAARSVPPSPAPRASRLPIIAAAVAVVLAGALAVAAAILWRVPRSLLTGRSPERSTQAAAVRPGDVPGAPGSLPPLPGSWDRGNPPAGARDVQGASPGAPMPGVTASHPSASPGPPPGQVAANAPAGGITTGVPRSAPGTAVTGAQVPGSQGPGGAAVTAGTPGSLPPGASVTAGTPGNVPSGRSVAAGTPGNQPSAPAVTAHPPSSAPSAPPVTGGRSGEVPPAPSLHAGQPGNLPAGRSVTGREPGETPKSPSVTSSNGGQVPTGPSVQGNRPPASTPPRATAPRGPDPRERNLVAEYLRRLELIQARDNQLNQQIGDLGGGWLGDAYTLGGLQDPAEFILRYARITQGMGQVAAAKQNLGNQFLNSCGPIARACPPVQNLHNWYIRYFQEWVQATQTLYGALRTRNLGLAMQVESQLSRVRNTKHQCDHEEDRVRDRYDIPHSPFGPR
ncbi:MAG TPA: zinc-ribbon domain-containing protein [Armatimonadota bacterium]|nr:zinc-ribbon domain-containing protein [Armatimonadota bacterium]